jgi:chromosomal replication initiator protein
MWGGARERLRRELGDAVFDAWIGPLELLSIDSTEIRLGAPKLFVRNWVSNHYVSRIERALSVEGCRRRCVSIVLAPPKVVIGGGLPRDSKAFSAPAVAPVHEVSIEGSAEPRRGLWNRVLHPAQSFESFVVGPSNEFACSAARAFAEGENNETSLLYLHGGFGYGKSHILNATALEARSRGRRALFLGAEDFMRQFLGALHRRETLMFKEELRAADLLLIDDLQHICRSSSTISEFLHTVNAFSDLRRRIVIAADRSPEAFDALGADVRSRLSGGLVIALGKPDRETRLGIVKLRLQEFARHRPHVAFPDDILERIADLEDASPRELVGVLTKLATYADLTKKPVTLCLAEEAIGQRGMPGRKTGIEDIQRKTAEFYKLEVRDLHSKERSRRVARPRQVAMYLSRELTMRSLPEIGRRFGNRDHTTVLHACRRITELCTMDPLLRQEVDFLKQVLSKRSEIR